MPGKAAKVAMTERQQEVLLTMSRTVTSAFQLRQHAQIILLGFEGQLNSEIEDLVGLGPMPSVVGGDAGSRSLNGSRWWKVITGSTSPFCLRSQTSHRTPDSDDSTRRAENCNPIFTDESDH